MLFAWYTCCGMLFSMRNRDENVTRFMTSLLAAGLSPDGVQSLVRDVGDKKAHERIAGMAVGGFHNLAASNILELAVYWEKRELWLVNDYRVLQETVRGLGAKCSIILYELWNPSRPPPGIAVDVHVLNLAKSLGLFQYDCQDQAFVQSTLESFIPPEFWPKINLLFGGLFQFLYMSRGQEEHKSIMDAAITVGPVATTMIQLFGTTKRLVAAESLKKELASVQSSLASMYEYSLHLD